MKTKAFLVFALLLCMNASALGIGKTPSPDGTALTEADCRALFLGQQSCFSDGRFVTAVVCRDDLDALEAFFGGVACAEVFVFPTRGEAAAFCECHCGCVLLYPV